MLTLVGTSVVFALLALLVGVVHATSKLSGLLEGEGTAAPQHEAAPLEEELVSVVASAVRMFRGDSK